MGNRTEGHELKANNELSRKAKKWYIVNGKWSKYHATPD